MSIRSPGRLAVLAAVAVLQPACGGPTDLSFFVLVKSSNYAQDSSGVLTRLNYHFFSEIFLAEGGSLDGAALTLPSRPAEPLEYVNRGSNYYVEGGHFDTLEELDRAYPNGTFVFDIVAPRVRLAGEELRLAGPDGETDLPVPITISLFQEGRAVSPLEIDPQQALVIRWSDYSNGGEDPRGIVDDMIFVVVADCHGRRVYHTGLPFQGEYLTYQTTEVLVAANTLSPGQPYSMFVEFPHVVDSRVIDGVPGFTSYATATYLDLRTTGASSDSTCPDIPPPMDTGQTDRGRGER
jgi:hypothetical protein